MVNICRNNRKERVSLGPNFFLSGTVHWERGRNWVNSYARFAYLGEVGDKQGVLREPCKWRM